MNENQLIVRDWQDSIASSQAAPRSSSILRDGESLWWSGGGITGVYGITPSTGIAFSEGRAMTSATAYACTRARAETLASLPAIVYSQVSKVIRERAHGTDAWYLLHDEPNPNMSAMTFYELMNMRQVNRGNGFAEIERDRSDRPIALWPIHPSRVSPRRDNGRIVWDVYTDVKDPINDGYKVHVVADRDMLNICGFGGNGILAPGVIDMGREEISIDIAAQQYGAKWFGSGARPSGVVEHPGYIDDLDQRTEFRADMNRLHSGMENWHQIGIMWNGAKWKELQANPEQAQFLQTREFSAKQICRLYNVPPPIVQIFEDYKINTVDGMIMQFVKTCVRADAVRLEQELRRKVLSVRDARGRLMNSFDDDLFVEFLLEGLLRGDPKKQADTLEVKRRNGIINANEWRAIDNENPLEGDQGDKYIVPGGFNTLEAIGKVAPAVTPANSAGGSDNASATDANLPEFSRQTLIGALERSLKPRRNHVRGYRTTTRRTKGASRTEITAMAIEVLTEAVDRLETVARNEVARLQAKNQPIPRSTWDKHCARLESGVRPACKVYSRHSKKIDVDVMVRKLAVSLTDRLMVNVHDGTSDRNLAGELKAAAQKSIKVQ